MRFLVCANGFGYQLLQVTEDIAVPVAFFSDEALARRVCGLLNRHGLAEVGLEQLPPVDR